MLSDAEMAQQMFNAYNESGPNPWKTWDGKDVPRWHEVNDQVRGKWTAAATKARHILVGKGGEGFVNTGAGTSLEPSPSSPAPRPKPSDK